MTITPTPMPISILDADEVECKDKIELQHSKDIHLCQSNGLLAICLVL
jgi:hypothetical protein